MSEAWQGSGYGRAGASPGRQGSKYSWAVPRTQGGFVTTGEARRKITCHYHSNHKSLKNPRFPHLGLNTPLGFDPFLSLVEGKSSLGKLLVVVMVSTVDDNVVGCLCIVDISDVGHPLLVCLSSAVNIWREDNVLGPTLNCPPIHKFPSGLFGRRWPVWSQYCWISLCIQHMFSKVPKKKKVTCFSCRASPWRRPPLCFPQS